MHVQRSNGRLHCRTATTDRPLDQDVAISIDYPWCLVSIFQSKGQSPPTLPWVPALRFYQIVNARKFRCREICHLQRSQLSYQRCRRGYVQIQQSITLVSSHLMMQARRPTSVPGKFLAGLCLGPSSQNRCDICAEAS